MKKPAKRGAVLFIDLDRFKQANDTLGHTQGDRLLKMVAARLIEALPPGQTLARVGGDEFVVLLYDTAGPEDAISAAADLIAALRPLFRIDHHELVLSASIGISLCPEHGSDLAALQERADKAMFAAKSAGPGQFAIFSSEAADRESAMREIDRDLYLALPRGQLRVHYQPIVEHTGRLLGFEALVRWQHPTRGLVMPGDFISSAEKSGLIAGIGEWVLGEACRDCKTWQLPNGAPIGVAVNVSPVQFEQDDFPAQVMSILRQCEMVPSLVTLELTEGLLIREIDRTSAQLTGLRAAGVQVAIDDFGTGYSSLSYLTSLPVDAVKLDRSFINRSPATALSVVSSVVDMAHRIGLRVVAEGVETMIQARQIIGANCDEIQGLCFSGPIPAESVASFLRTNVTESGYVRSAAFPRTGRMSYKEVIRFQESAAS
jgi:diguanylate cyclase (GGDEF)-like protein